VLAIKINKLNCSDLIYNCDFAVRYLGIVSFKFLFLHLINMQPFLTPMLSCLTKTYAVHHAHTDNVAELPKHESSSL